MLSLLILAIAFAGVVLPVLAAAVAASRGAPDAAPAAPAPLGAAIPLAGLGLTWRRLRTVRTGRGERGFWVGDGDPARYTRAFRLAKGPLYEAGYSWGTAERSGGQVQPVCWEDPSQGDQVSLDAITAAEAALAADDVRIAEAETRRAREAELEAQLNGDARRADMEALQQSLRVKGWAWSRRKRDVAAALLAEKPGPGGAPRAAAAKLAREMVAEVDAAIEAVKARVASDQSHADWLAKAEDEDVRRAVHYATQILSDLDGDMASIENGVGWSKAHSHTGHVLAALPELSIIEATHALAAVWRHRRQVRPEFLRRIYGEQA
ncbi:hypothetical protein BHAOGJBA_4149 [Methylobacterium hispanicum]|uniref:Uncharacterized protein n=1 Tax=Methylobacterium hispanicum TaxID=270350 RepID=A0AAV4ZQ51_9HYPH|nr:hypothetical protein [Methylobacterium hispanicum]GJD90607.1 hypothetical protein BHAOGJBA_4149 [Methylobacterium hispanicum]